MGVWAGGRKMTKCSFCGREEHPFKGIHFIHNDGSVSFFCSSKCRKNALKLKRDKRRLKWTAAHSEERIKAAEKMKRIAKNPEKVEIKN